MMDDKYDTRWTIRVSGKNYFDKYLICLNEYIICMHMILFEYKVEHIIIRISRTCFKDIVVMYKKLTGVLILYIHDNIKSNC